MSQLEQQENKQNKENMSIQSLPGEEKIKLRAHMISPPATLTLHTWQAEKLFTGKWDESSYGVIQFARAIKYLWIALKKGDPYAEYYLIKTDDLLRAEFNRFGNIESELDQRLSKIRNLDVQLYESPHPFKHPLSFMNEFPYKAANLLVIFDYVIRKAHTLKKLGIYLKSDSYDAGALQNALHTLFKFPTEKWVDTGVTRQDIFEGNEKALFAKEKMGPIPGAILYQKFKPAFHWPS